MPLPARPLGCDPGVRQGSELWEQRGTEGPLGPRWPEQGVEQIQELTALAVPASLTHAGCVPGFGAMNESQSSRGAIPVLRARGSPGGHCWCFPGLFEGGVRGKEGCTRNCCDFTCKSGSWNAPRCLEVYTSNYLICVCKNRIIV